MIRAVFTSLCLGASLLSASALALTGEQIVEREVVVRHADGTTSVKRETADMVTPGDKVVYSLKYHNEKTEAAENIVLVMPVPTEVKYIEGSANNSVARTSYSADGGTTFAQRDGLNVTSDDGTQRAALAQDITHVRWIIGTAVAPGSGGTLSFSGLLK